MHSCVDSYTMRLSPTLHGILHFEYIDVRDHGIMFVFSPGLPHMYREVQTFSKIYLLS